MPRRRFVLRYRGDGPKPEADVERVRRLPEATMVDESSGRMMLVESDEGPLRELVESLPDWVAAPEQRIPVPDTRKRVKSTAGIGATRVRSTSSPADKPRAGLPGVGRVFDHHGSSRPRGLEFIPRSSFHEGRFGRMFRFLPPMDPPDEVLVALAESMRASRLPGAPAPPILDNPDLPAGYTYLGQFVDHDITFDPGSHLDRQNDPDGLHSFRTPRFDLDSLYGSGTADSPFLYDQEDPVKLLVGRNQAPIHLPEDLPRNQQGRALIGDPRNDVHVIIAQLHLAFIRFHNAAVDHLRSRFTPSDDLLDEASRLTRWHYQWVVVHDYVRRLVGSELLDQVLVADASTGGPSPALRFFRWQRQPFIPVEFSAAAYRFGHSQVRPGYQLNDTLDSLPMLPEARVPNPAQHLGGFRPLPKNWTVQWDRFLSIGGSSPQLSATIDTLIADPLTHLPENVDGRRRSLALLNLLRGKALGLPSGQAVAAAMGTTVADDMLGLDGPTPLWFYLLREAEVIAGGRRLGPTAGRIVAEVLVGLLQADPSSFLRVSPSWRPELPAEHPGHFTLVDFLRFAGVAPLR